jgi:YD repeat-containing protein
MAGPVLAGNAERQPVSKPASFVSKAWKGFGKVRNERAMQLRTGETDAANVSLRSTLEPGHNRPDSAIYHNVYDNKQHPEMKRVFTYAGNVVKETVYGREWESGTWRNDVLYEEEYTFDAYGNQTLSIYWFYSNGELYGATKDESAYNPNGMSLYERYSGWKNGGEWTLNTEATYQYDASGMITGGTVYASYLGEAAIPLTVSGTLENMELSVMINGVIYMKLVLHCDPVTMKLLGREYFEMNEETGALEPGSVEEYTYDAAGRLLTKLYYWNDEDIERTEYAYDNAGRKLSEIRYYARYKDDPFTIYKTEYEYDGNRLVRLKQYNDYNDDSVLTLREVTVFYYSGATGNEQVTLTEVSVYPNPVTDVLTVSGVQAGATLTVTSLSGSTVVRKTLADTQTTLSVSSLPSGIYFVTVRSGKGTATFKIIKK